MKTYRDKSNNEASPLVRRTRDGSREMVAKNLDLSSAQRKILLHANGRRTVDEIAGIVSGLKTNSDLLFALESAGLVELFVPEEGLPLPRETEAAPRDESRPAEPAVASADLQPLKARLAEELTAVLGAESAPAVQKVQAVRSAEELHQMLPKLTELVKLYAGAAAGERFAAKFNR